MLRKRLIKVIFNKSHICRNTFSPFLTINKSISKRSIYQQNSIKLNYSTSNQSIFVFNMDKQPELLSLQLQYRGQQDISIFEKCIKSSTGVLDQMNIFKIFKVIQKSPFNEQAYLEFFNLINKNVKRKSDNMLLLMGTIKQRIARNHESSQKYSSALKLLEQSLEILQQCMVPQLMPYYSVYREYGLLIYLLGDKKKAKEILTQAVDVLEDFVNHSDDHVSTDYFSLKQATACNVLAEIDPENHKKWVQNALIHWQNYSQNKFSQIEYAKTVYQNLKILSMSDKQKAQAYYNLNLYQFQTNQTKEILKRFKTQNQSSQ